MNRFRFYLDGMLLTDPEGWDGFIHNLERIQDVPESVLEAIQGALTFSGEGYTYLSSLKAGGWCAKSDVLVEEACDGQAQYKPVYKGTIFIPDVEFNRTICTAKCTLVDNSFDAFINNNRSIEAIINNGKTKNGEDLTDITRRTIGMFDPCNAAALSDSLAFRAYDVIGYLISFLTDNRVGFRSTILDVGGDWEGLYLTGDTLLGADAAGYITLSLDDALNNIGHIIPLSYHIDDTGILPVFVLESRESMYGDTPLINFTEVGTLLEKTDSSRSYSEVSFGSGDIINSLGCSVNEPAFADQLEFVGCKSETFIVEHICNLNNRLDLSVDWIISSNVIEEIKIMGSTDYQDKVIFLHVDITDPVTLDGDAVQTEIYGTALPVVYNAALYNDKVANRFLGGIPNTLVKRITVADTGFLAYRTGAETITTPAAPNALGMELYPMPFGQDYAVGSAIGYDNQNDYGNGTAANTLVTQANSRYTAPALGAYQFRCRVGKIIAAYGGNQSVVTVTFHHRDSGGTLITESEHPTFFNTAGVKYITIDSYQFIMSPGDFVDITLQWRIHSTIVIDPLYPCTFELLTVNSFGGVFKEYDPNDYINNEYRFTYPMTRQQYKSIRENPEGLVTVTSGNFSAQGWIKSVKYRPSGPSGGQADITIVSNGTT